MANTFTQIYIQVVFAVEWRQALIRPFKDEYMRLLRRFDVAFDERYLFDFADQDAPAGTESSTPKHITPLGGVAVVAAVYKHSTSTRW